MNAGVQPQRPLAPNESGIFGTVECQECNKKFALWRKQNRMPPHLAKDLTGLCQTSGAYF